ncbi:MAG: glycosyltransferase family 2 protein [Chitinophagaceae bacterium]|nr:MAG: glycosyltransferase family 2 protein [Chitinophagaceae bacterium]
MLFSILIANYNNGNYFKDCYASIAEQTYQKFEVIIIDDGSTDDSIHLIETLIKNDPRFRLYKNEKNSGCGYTKRKCAELAAGDICGFLDPDDALDPIALEVMVKAHQEHPQASLVHSTLWYCDDDLKKIKRYEGAKPVVASPGFTNIDIPVIHFTSYKNEHYRRTQGINPNQHRAVDIDLYLKLSEVGEFVFLDQPLYKYRIHKNGISTSNRTKAFYGHLKAIAAAEDRRGVNLENEVEPVLVGQGKSHLFYEARFCNPKYLVYRLWLLFKQNPAGFLKSFFVKQK